jgi:hypothetical protein
MVEGDATGHVCPSDEQGYPDTEMAARELDRLCTALAREQERSKALEAALRAIASGTWNRARKTRSALTAIQFARAALESK